MGNLYALKKISALNEEMFELAKREIEAYKLFHDPSIMQLVDSAINYEGSSRIVYILLPYYKHGNLQDLINRNLATGREVSKAEALKLFRGITIGLIQLHENPRRETSEEFEPLMEGEAECIAYAHLDLKPANLMLTDDMEIVLMDLGSCRRAKREVPSRSEA